MRVLSYFDSVEVGSHGLLFAIDVMACKATPSKNQGLILSYLAGFETCITPITPVSPPPSEPSQSSGFMSTISLKPYLGVSGTGYVTDNPMVPLSDEIRIARYQT